MSKIKVAELFYSIQGEGRYMGVPSVFLRTFGCNFKCAGFGMPRGQLSEEANNVDPGKYSRYEELPLVSTGCDSYASWDPRFKDLSPLLTSNAIADRIMEILPHGKWRDEHLVITGGEPLLGWQRAYPDLLNHPRMRKLKEITFETNGTQELSEEFAEYLMEWQMPGINFSREVTFSVSAKLPASGESWSEAIRPDVVHHICFLQQAFELLRACSVANLNQITDQRHVNVKRVHSNALYKDPFYLIVQFVVRSSEDVESTFELHAVLHQYNIVVRPINALLVDNCYV